MLLKIFIWLKSMKMLYQFLYNLRAISLIILFTFPLTKVFDSVKILYNFCNIFCGYVLFNIHQSEI